VERWSMLRSINRVALWCGLLILAAPAGGCQRRPTWDLVPVEGTVTKDGRPLAGIEVTYWADVAAGTRGPRTSGFTDDAGHYELRTDKGGRGAAIGQYRVCLLVPSAPSLVPSNTAHTQQANLPKVVKPPEPNAVQLLPAYSRFEE